MGEKEDRRKYGNIRRGRIRGCRAEKRDPAAETSLGLA